MSKCEQAIADIHQTRKSAEEKKAEYVDFLRNHSQEQLASKLAAMRKQIEDMTRDYNASKCSVDEVREELKRIEEESLMKNSALNNMKTKMSTTESCVTKLAESIQNQPDE